MAKTITQKILFQNAKPEDLFSLYMDAKKHAVITGAKTKIKKKEDSKFSFYDHHVKGRNLQIVENELIVQSWRASDWHKSDLDSTVVILLVKKGSQTELLLTHANIPDRFAAAVSKAWDELHWKGWRKFLQARSQQKEGKRSTKAKPSVATKAKTARKKLASKSSK